MTRKFSKWKIIIALCVLVVGCFVLAACSKTFLPEENGYNVFVTYDANGGKFGTTDTTGIKIYKYKPNVSIMEPGGKMNEQLMTPILTHQHVLGWFVVDLDEEGKPRKNENGELIISDRQWDFSKDRLPDEENARLYLAAKWERNYSLTINVGEEARAAGVENVVNWDYTSPGPVSRPGQEPSWSGHTFHYYSYQGKRLQTDSDWKQLVLSDETPDLVVDVVWLEGVWKVVTDPSDFSSVMEAANYYIDADLDMKGRKITFPTQYTGEFNGMGHTIRNITVNQDARNTRGNYGLLNCSGKGFVHDITFVNVSYNVSLYRIPNGDSTFNIGLLSGNGSTLDLSKFTNVGLIDCSISITKKYILNDGDPEPQINAGIFGKLAEGQTFTPAQGSTPVRVTIQ